MSAVVFAVLTIVTALWPDWIEELTGLDPDAGSGALELAVVAAFALVALVCGALALRTPLRIRGAQR